MKRFKRRLSQTLRGSHTIDESLSELAEQMTIEENGLKDSGTFILYMFILGGSISDSMFPKDEWQRNNNARKGTRRVICYFILNNHNLHHSSTSD